MSTEDPRNRDPRGAAQAAEIAASEQEWNTLEDAAYQLLSYARMGKQGELDIAEDDS